MRRHIGEREADAAMLALLMFAGIGACHVLTTIANAIAAMLP